MGVSVTGPRRWPLYLTDAPCHSRYGMLKNSTAQWPWVPSIGQNLQPFTGNGDVSIWVKNSRMGRSTPHNKIKISNSQNLSIVWLNNFMHFMTYAYLIWGFYFEFPKVSWNPYETFYSDVVKLSNFWMFVFLFNLIYWKHYKNVFCN